MTRQNTRLLAYTQLREDLAVWFQEDQIQFHNRVLENMESADSLRSRLNENLQEINTWASQTAAYLDRHGLLQHSVFHDALREATTPLKGASVVTLATSPKLGDAAAVLSKFSADELDSAIITATTQLGFDERQTNRVRTGMPPYPAVADAAQIFSDMVGALHRYGLINREFFAVLRSALPEHSDIISDLERRYLDNTAPPLAIARPQNEGHYHLGVAVVSEGYRKRLVVTLFGGSSSEPITISRALLPDNFNQKLQNTMMPLSAQQSDLARPALQRITRALANEILDEEMLRALLVLDEGSVLHVILDSETAAVEQWLPNLPWEALVIGDTFLGARFIMTRQFSEQQPPTLLPRATIYDAMDPDDVNIRHHFSAVSATLAKLGACTPVNGSIRLRQLLEGKLQADILHVTCHGAPLEQVGLGGAIIFAGNQLSPSLIAARPDQAHALQGKLVFLNICRSGAGRNEGVISGWVSRMIRFAEVGALITTSWSVRQEQVKQMVNAFYQHLLGGELSLAEALWRARRDSSFVDPLAYALYAAPDAALAPATATTGSTS